MRKEKPGKDPVSMALTNFCRANLGHREARRRVVRWQKVRGGGLGGAGRAKTMIGKRKGLGSCVLWEALPSPRTVKLLKAKRSLKPGGDPGGPW